MKNDLNYINKTSQFITQKGLLLASLAFFLFSVVVSFASSTLVCPVDTALNQVFGKHFWNQCVDGVDGKQGPQGAKGLDGEAGKNGLNGNAGKQGEAGLDGINGNNGFIGASGGQGVAGLNGANGTNGASGAQGIAGLAGTNGTNGSNGPQGIQGLTGAQGIQGLTGSTGLTGATGLTGSQGIPGLDGSNGIDGAVGPQGLTGATGLIGTQGPIGLTGLTGLTGAPGLQGIQGFIGLTGPQGPIGLTGSQGVQGSVGLTGAQGIQGISGVLTVTDDTNITGSISGQNLTLGWAGVLATSRGGTGLSSIGSANQILTVNAAGTALEYTNPSVALNANNGLSLAGNDVQLGGNLIQSTAVDGAGNDLAFVNNNKLSLGGNNIDIGNNSNSFSGNPNQIAIGQNNSLFSDNQIVLGNENRLIGSNNFLIGASQDFSNIDNGSSSLYSFGFRNSASSNGILNDVYLFGNRNNLSNSISYQDTYILGGSNDIQGSTSLTLGSNNVVKGSGLRAYTLGNNNVNDGKDLFLIGQNLSSGNGAEIQFGFSDTTKTIIDSGGRLTLQGPLNVNGTDGNAGAILSSTGSGGAPQWIGPFGTGNVSVGNGLTNNGSSIFINSPTCTGTQKLSWNGLAFVCSTDLNNVYTAGTGINVSGGNVISNSGLLSIATSTGSTGLTLTPTTTSGAVTQVLSGTLAIANGGTGSTTQNFVDLTTAQSIAGNKTFTSNLAQTGTGTFSTGTGNVSLNGATSLASSLSQAGIAAPSLSASGQGSIYFDSTSNTFRVSQNGSAYTNLIGATSLFSGLTAATNTNTLNNLNFAQTWNWSTATTQNPLTLSANSLTSGSGLAITTNSGSLNSTNGLFNVANTGASTNGILARLQSNNTAGSGLTVATNGNIGIGTTSPGGTLDLLSQSGTATARFTNYGNTNDIYLRRAQGTILSPTIAGSGSVLGRLIGQGYDGSTFQNGASISLEADGTTGAGIMPGRIVFNTSPTGSSTLAPRVIINNNGQFTINALGTGTVQSTAGALSVSSDERLKVISSSFNRGLKDLQGISPIQYKWNEASGLPTNVPLTGFSAQNIQANIPEAVNIDSRGFLTLDDRPIIATVINSIKELNTKIDSRLSADNSQVATLKTITDSLDSRVTKLEGEIKDLKTQLANSPVSPAPKTPASPIENLDKAISEYFATNSSLYLSTTGGTIAKLEVSGNLLVKGNLKVNGNVDFDGELTVGDNTAGEAIIPAGKTKIRITFTPALKNAPIVSVTPINSEAKFKIINKTKTGFEIVLTELQPADTTFDWIVVSK